MNRATETHVAEIHITETPELAETATSIMFFDSLFLCNAPD